MTDTRKSRTQKDGASIDWTEVYIVIAFFAGYALGLR